MKILVINWQDILNPLGGGAEVHCHEIFKRIAAKGHSVTQFSCLFSGADTEEDVDGIHIVRAGSRSTFNFSVPLLYRKRFRDEAYDLVIDDINKIPFYTPLYVKEPVLALSHHFFGKSIFREASFIPAAYVYLSEKLVDYVYKNTPFAVVSKSTLDEFIERGFNVNRFRIIPNAIDQNAFPMKVSAKEPVPTIAYFTRIKRYKSPDHLLRAFAILKRNIPNAVLWFIGSGDYTDELGQMAQNLGLSQSVVFHGRVSEEQKIDLLSRAWCTANTSMKEGWGITNIEANACGTPVISSDVPGLRDSVMSGRSGLLYPYGDIVKLADQLKLICTHSDTRQQLSESSIEWARSFSWDQSANQMLEYCTEVIEKAHHVR